MEGEQQKNNTIDNLGSPDFDDTSIIQIFDKMNNTTLHIVTEKNKNI